MHNLEVFKYLVIRLAQSQSNGTNEQAIEVVRQGRFSMALMHNEDIPVELR